jgi:hypothetical protein
MPLDNDSHRNATARFRNSDDLEPVRQAAWSVHAIDEAAEEVRAIVAKHLTPTDSTKALQALNHVYVGAPQNVKDAIVHNPDALLILECAAGEANAPLTKKVAGPVLRKNGPTPPCFASNKRRDVSTRDWRPRWWAWPCRVMRRSTSAMRVSCRVAGYSGRPAQICFVMW